MRSLLARMTTFLVWPRNRLEVRVETLIFKPVILHSAAAEPMTQRYKHRGNVRRRVFGASESSWRCTGDCHHPINIRHSERALQWALGTGTEACRSGSASLWVKRDCGWAVWKIHQTRNCLCVKLLVELIHTVMTQNCTTSIADYSCVKSFYY